MIPLCPGPPEPPIVSRRLRTLIRFGTATVLGVWLPWVAWLAIVNSAEAQPSLRAQAEATVDPAEVYALLDQVWVRDERGRLLPWSNLTYQELARWRRVIEGMELPAPPNVVISRVEATGELRDQLVDWEIQIEIRTTSPAWTRIPLPLPRGFLRDAQRYEGKGEFELVADARGELTGWLKGDPQEPHRLVLPYTTSIDVRGNLRRLDLSFPKAAVSLLALRIPGKQIEVQNSSNAGILTTSMDGETTKLNVQGFQEPFWVQWSERPAEQPAGPAEVTALVAVSQIRAIVEGPGQVASVADFVVTCPRSRAVNSLEVTLPAHAQFTDGMVSEVPDAEFAEIIPPVTDPAVPPPHIVRISLRRPFETIKFQLNTRTERAPNADVADGGIDVAGFRVSQAVRQNGTVQLTWRGPWEVRPKPSGNLRRTSANKTGTTAGSARDSEAWFEFFQQPCELRVSVAERPTQLRVDPKYTFKVDADGVSLIARLAYRLRGIPPEEIQVEMGDWEVVGLEPRQQIEQSAETWEQRDGVLHVPLWPLGSAASTEFQLEIRAQRPLDLTHGSVVPLDIPRPNAESLSGATYEILTHENVQVALPSAFAASLVPDNASESSELESGYRSEGTYRLPATNAPRQVECDVHVLKKVITAEVVSQATLDALSVEIRQEFRYRVQHERIQSFNWIVPRELLKVPCEITIDGQTISTAPWATTRDFREVPGDAERVIVSVYLPQHRSGRFPVSIRYRIPLAKGNQQQIPLIMPEVDQLDGNSLTIQGNSKWRILQAARGDWTLPHGTSSDSTLALPTLEMRSALSLGHAEMTLEPIAPRERQLVRVERFWLQSWFSNGARRDRAVFRFLTQAATVTLKLPRDAQVLHAILDGEPMAWEAHPVTAEGAHLIPLRQSGTRDSSHTLEIAYNLPSRNWTQTKPIVVPTLEHVAWTGRSDWNLVLPSHEYLLLGSSTLTPEEQWSWNGIFWKRTPTWSQNLLEQQLGATKQTTPSATAQEYSFSTISAMPSFMIRTIPRVVAALLLSGTALGMGMGLLYMPALRHPMTLLFATCALIPLIAVAPTYALFLAQLAGPGAVLSIVGFSLYRFLIRGIQTRTRSIPSVRTGHGSSRGPTPIASTATVVPTGGGSSIPSVMP